MKNLKPKVLGVIPARFASQRLPGKPLREIAGKPLIQWVWESASRAKKLSDLVVATDSTEIAEVVRSFAGKVVMTDPELSSGSERVLEVTKQKKETWDIVLNIQGDMPFIPGGVIDQLVDWLFEKSKKFSIGTLAIPIISRETFLSPHVVKVVVTEFAEALYFSRAPIPFPRDGEEPQYKLTIAGQHELIYGLQHIGLYAFTRNAFQAFAGRKISILEQVEKLEQLRAMELGFKIGVCVIKDLSLDYFAEVNTEADIKVADHMADLMMVNSSKGLCRIKDDLQV